MLAARLAAGATIQAALAVARGEAAVAFAVVRPPGHHARAERAAGFCLLNNVALAAMALRAAGLAQRIAIVDWDVHHGDGTQAIFDADPDLCYASTHQMPLYPGSGDAAERGRGRRARLQAQRPPRPGERRRPVRGGLDGAPAAGGRRLRTPRRSSSRPGTTPIATTRSPSWR